MKVSSGIFLFRKIGQEVEYLLVRPGGPFYKNLHKGIWTIPKGIVQEEETEIEAAQREFLEETGQKIVGKLTLLGRIKLRKGKKLTAYFVEGDINEKAIISNTFEMEYPKNSGAYQSFPEIEKGEWFTYEIAKELIHPKLIGLLEQLKGKIT